MITKYFKLFLGYHAMVTFLVHTSLVHLQYVIMCYSYISVLFKRWICYILLFHLSSCNVTYVLFVCVCAGYMFRIYA
jgi:hypothetical protein